MLKKKTAPIIITALSIITLASCAPKPGDTVAWLDSDRNDAEMAITYGDFSAEYRFLLYTQQVDENDPEKAEEAKQMRQNVIDYQIKERRYLRIAEEMGIGESALTEAEWDLIRQNTDDKISEYRESFRSSAEAAFAKTPTDEQLEKRIQMLYERMLRETGINEEILALWEKNDFIQEKLLTHIADGVIVTDEDFEKTLEDMREKAKADIAENPNVYRYDYAHYLAYIPPDCRDVKQILIALDEIMADGIRQFRAQAGSKEDADKFRDDMLTDITEKAEGVLARLDGGEDFDAVMREVSDDRELIDNGRGVYRIIPGFTEFGEEYEKAVFALRKPGEYSRLVPTDMGWVILRYEGLTADNYTESERQEDYVYLRGTYLDYKRVEEKDRLEAEWNEKYKFRVDWKKLKINKPAEG